MTDRIVIIGASAAGVATAEALQRQVPDREVVVIGDEPTIAHDRPPLSKQVLDGSWAPDRAELLPAARRDALKARIVLGHRVLGIDAAARTVRVDDGSGFTYGDLVIATGVRPRKLAGDTPEGVHVLRDMEDCLRLRAAMTASPGRRMVIIGGGFIGLEVAATARKLGVHAALIEPDPTRLGLRLGLNTAARLLALHRAQGVDFHLKLGVAGYTTDANNQVTGVRLSNGATLAADIVLVAIGCQPNVEFLAGAGLDLSDGVVCDAFCRAAPCVWAAGDVARWHHIGLGRTLRVEHRLNATEQGHAVAANIAGAQKPFTPVPFFWTDQYDVKLQLAGVIPDTHEETAEQLSVSAYLHTFHASGKLAAVLGWNAARAMMPLRQQLAAAARDVSMQPAA